MSNETDRVVAGLDVGTECVKAVVLGENRSVLGRAVVPTRGYFQDRAGEALGGALEEAQRSVTELRRVCLTGFGARGVNVSHAMTASDSACHARAAYYFFPEPMTVVDIGGREPKLVYVNEGGCRTEVRTVRRCGVGIGTFLMYSARHLDVHPTRLMELAAGAERPASVGSYCSMFAESEVLERLRDGASREDVALGCMYAVAARILEMGSFRDRLTVTGGVPELFPGVVDALEKSAGLQARIVPRPITAAAFGAALLAVEADG